MVITYREITGQTVVEDASPMSRQIHVAIAILLIVVEGKAVTAIVSIDIQLVTHVEGMREGTAHIVESGLTILVSTLFRQHAQEPITIGGTSTKQQRSTFLPQRDFQIQLAGQQTDACYPYELLLIGFLSRDVQYRRDTSTILARNTALVDFHIGHHVAIESRKEAEQVSRIINRTSIQEHQVLVGRATTYIEATGRFAYRLHTRQGLHHLQHIHFAHSGRNVLQERWSNLFHPQCRTLDCFHTSTGHQYFFEHQVLFFQFDANIGIGIQHQLTTGILHTDTLQLQNIVSRSQFDFETSVHICCCCCPWIPTNDVNPYRRTIGLEVDDLSGQLNLLRFRRTELVADFIHLIFRSQYFRYPHPLVFILCAVGPSLRKVGTQIQVLHDKHPVAKHIHLPESSTQCLLQLLQRSGTFLFLHHKRLRYIGIYLVRCSLLYLLHQTNDVDAVRDCALRLSR